MTAHRRKRVGRIVGFALALHLAVAGTAVVLLQPEGSPRPAPAAASETRGPAQPATRAPSAFAAAPVPETTDARSTAVQALLDRRATALLTRDRTGFLASVDPRATGVRAEQAALFDALADVPLQEWGYALVAGSDQEPDTRLTARYGTWWGTRVTLRHEIAGVDSESARSTQHLTFVQRGASWYFASDDDFAGRGDVSQPGLWDGGPVVVRQAEHGLVLSHPGSESAARRIAAELDRAVPRVSAAVGPDWSQRVLVVLPGSVEELDRLVTTGASLTRIAALAVAGPGPGGDRVFVNPAALGRIGPTALRVVLTHEVTHVAAHRLGGPDTPLWLSEGLADHVGYLGADVPVGQAAAELRERIRAGRVPSALPTDADFSGDNPDLALAYEGAWLAYELLVEQRGEAGALRLYREVGTGTPLGEALGTSPAAFTAAWQDSLRSRLR